MRTKAYPIILLMLVGVSLLLVQSVTAAFGNIKLNAPLVSNGDVSGMLISPNDQWVVYIADQDTDDVFEVYSTRLDGGVSPIKLSGSLVSHGDVDTFRGLMISPDGAWVVYRADQDSDNVFEIYSVPIDGSNNPTKLNGTLVDGGEVSRFADEGFLVSPDSQWVVYRADQDTDNVYELYSVPIDGSSSPVKLNGPLVSGGNVSGFSSFRNARIGSNSDWVVYQADQDTYGVVELYSVRIDGSSSPVKLNPPMVAGGSVLRHQLSPDGQWVIYSADQDTDNVQEVFSVPIDGSRSPVKLNDSVNKSVISSSLSVSPDSNQVVYVADQDLDANDYELYSVPIDGSGSPNQLASAPLVYGSPPFGSIVISPDNHWVVYGVDDGYINRNLFSVPIDGSLNPVELSSLVPYQWIYMQKITADSSKVVYSFAAETSDGDSIFSVPIDGSESAIRLDSPTSSDFVSMRTFALSDDGNRVVFLSNQDTYNVYELYSVPIDGSQGQITLNGTLVSGGTVSNYQISTDTQQVVYLADQDTDNVFELYASKVPQFVTIDIMPSRSDNLIFCQWPQQRIPVVLLSDESFDALSVDHTTVTFAGASDYQIDPRTGEPVRREQDVDRDGDNDLLFYFLLRDTNLTCDSIIGTLQGETFDGQPIVGSDMVKMVTRR